MFKIFQSFARKSEEQKEKKRKYRELFLSNPKGREVLMELMKEARLFSNNYGNESLEYTEGKRHVIYFILNIMYNSLDVNANINQLMKEFDND